MALLTTEDRCLPSQLQMYPNPEFIEPENWPLNSPDLNPIDYSIWGALQQLVYRKKICDLDHLKQVLTSCWEQIRQDFIDKAIDQWLIRISLVMRARGTLLTSFGLCGPCVMREKHRYK